MKYGSPLTCMYAICVQRARRYLYIGKWGLPGSESGQEPQILITMILSFATPYMTANIFGPQLCRILLMRARGQDGHVIAWVCALALARPGVNK